MDFKKMQADKTTRTHNINEIDAMLSCAAWRLARRPPSKIDLQSAAPTKKEQKQSSKEESRISRIHLTCSSRQ